MHLRAIAFAIAVAMPAAASAAIPAGPQLITFDDIATSHEMLIANGYAGLNWSNFGVLNTTNNEPSGYDNGVVSGPNVAFNNGGTGAAFSSASPFSLESGDFTGAWNNGLSVTATGYGANGATIGTQSFTVNTSGPTLENFGWQNVSMVTFSAQGGVRNTDFPDGAGTHFALDDLKISRTSGAPEPASWAMMAIGLGAIGFAMRKRAGDTRTDQAIA